MQDHCADHLMEQCVGGDAIAGLTAHQQERGPAATGVWSHRLLDRQPARLVSVAVADKTALIAWTIFARGEIYRVPLAV